MYRWAETLAKPFRCSPPNSQQSLFLPPTANLFFFPVVARKLMNSLSLSSSEGISCSVLITQAALKMTCIVILVSTQQWQKAAASYIYQPEISRSPHCSRKTTCCLSKHGHRIKRKRLWMQCSAVRLPASVLESPNKLLIYTVYKISFKMSINPSSLNVRLIWRKCHCCL